MDGCHLRGDGWGDLRAGGGLKILVRDQQRRVSIRGEIGRNLIKPEYRRGITKISAEVINKGSTKERINKGATAEGINKELAEIKELRDQQRRESMREKQRRNQ